MLRGLPILLILFTLLYSINLNAQTLTVGAINANYLTDGTNDEVEIQAAIDALAANNGGIVLLSAQTFHLGSKIIPKSNVQLIGTGISQTILKSNHTFDYVLFNHQTPIDNFHLKQLTIDPSNAQNASGVRLNYATNCSVESVKFINVTCDGWHLVLGIHGDQPEILQADYGRNNLVDNCEFDGHQGSLEMLLVFNTKNTIIRNSTFKNKTRNCPTDGNAPILGLWQRTDSILIENCQFLNNESSEAIYYSSSSFNTIIKDCQFNNTGSIRGANDSDWEAVNELYEYAENLKIDNCQFMGGANDRTKMAIQLGGIQNALIKDCTIEAYEEGITFQGGHTLAGNGHQAPKHWAVINTIIKNSNPNNDVHGLHGGALFTEGTNLNGFFICGRIFDDQATPTMRYPLIFDYLDPTIYPTQIYDSIFILGTELSPIPSFNPIQFNHQVVRGNDLIFEDCTTTPLPNFCATCATPQSMATYADLMDDYDAVTAQKMVILDALSITSEQDQLVTTGLGGYNLAPPPNGQVPQHSSGATALPQVTNSFDKPIQTNDWWSSLLYKYYQNQTFLWEIHSWKLFAHPLAFTANRYGLDIKYPDQATVEDYFGFADAKYQYPMSNQDFTIGVEGLDMGITDTVKTADYGDWHVQAEWLDANGKQLQATMAHGSPYAFFESNSDDIYLRFLFGHTIDNTISSHIIGFTTQGHHYAIFAPAGTTWDTNANYTFDENNLVNGPSNPFARAAFKADLQGKRYFSIAILPDNSLATLQEFASHAFAFIEDTAVSWNYDAATAKLTNTFTVETAVKEGTETNTLQALYRHQWKHSADVNTAHTYVSARGQMKVVNGNTFTTTLKNQGVLPVLPPVLEDAEKTTLYQFIADEYAATNTYITNNDTYWQGKRFGRQADLIMIADQVGHTLARDKFITDLKAQLEDWFTADIGETDRGYFYYDENWHSLIGYPASFGSDIRVTDHHFHYGYFIKAAATIARFDANWIADNQWGSMVKLLIKDVNNWDRTDEMFPFLRYFDAYAGHSWANGHANFHWGNDQEASSESINFAAWVYALGLYTDDTQMRDFGLFLYLNEAEAAEQYWFDKDEQVFPNGYGYQTATRIWGNGADKILGTTFEAESEYQLGINTFPIHAPLLYLGGDSTTIAKAHTEAAMIGDGIGDLWEDIMWGYLAMARPDEALADYLIHTTDGFYNTDAPWLPDVSGIYNDFSDHSLAPAQIYHWLHALDSLGTVDTTCANYPAAMVFQKNGIKNYVVDNTNNTDLLVNFSDGEQILVPANSMETKPIPTSACLAELTNLNIDNQIITGSYVAASISTENTVTATTQATFKAKNSITLANGFHAQAGSAFLAIIENCTSSLQPEAVDLSKRIIPSKTDLITAQTIKTPALTVFPNPFSSQFTLNYFLPTTGTTSIYLTNILGEKLWVFNDKMHQKGNHQLTISTVDLVAGAYFIVLNNGDTATARQIVRL